MRTTKESEEVGPRPTGGRTLGSGILWLKLVATRLPNAYQPATTTRANGSTRSWRLRLRFAVTGANLADARENGTWTKLMIAPNADGPCFGVGLLQGLHAEGLNSASALDVSDGLLNAPSHGCKIFTPLRFHDEPCADIRRALLVLGCAIICLTGSKLGFVKSSKQDPCKRRRPLAPGPRAPHRARF